MVGDPMDSTPLHFLILLVASWLRRHQAEALEYLQAENRVLRARLGPKRLRFTDPERRLLASRGKLLGRKRLAEVASLATPETILRWYREKVAAKYDGSAARRRPGRRRSRGEGFEQLLTMARENPSWGYTRLRGALRHVGHDLGRSTIQRFLKERGIEPAPVRGKTLPSARRYLRRGPYSEPPGPPCRKRSAGAEGSSPRTETHCWTPPIATLRQPVFIVRGAGKIRCGSTWCARV